MATGQRPPVWVDLLADTAIQVRRWATAPGALVAVYEIAHWLLNEGDLDSAAWNWLWSQDFTRPLRQPQTAPPAIRIADAAQWPQPAGAAQPTITAAQRDLQNLIAFYAVPGSVPAPTPERTLPHADQKHRPNGFYRPHFLVA